MKRNFFVVFLGLLILLFAVKILVEHFLFHHPLNFIPRFGDFIFVMIASLNAHGITHSSKTKLS